MPYRYPPEFRGKVLDLLAAGRSVASVAADLEVSDQTIHTWRKQELVGDRTYGLPLRITMLPGLEHDPHSTIPHLRRIPPRSLLL